MADDSTSPLPEAEETYARYLLEKRHGASKSVDELYRSNPNIAPDLREIHSRWTSRRSLAERLKDEKGVDVTSVSVSLEGGGLETEPAGDARESSGSSATLRKILEQGPSSGRYDLQGEIARGGMGAILKVWDEDLRRTLAMKVVLGTGEDEADVSEVKLVRFLEEAQITGQLDHPGVVPVHEIGLDAAGRVFFTMQLVKGRDLKQIFELVHEEREGWNQTRALGVLLRVCEAMAFAHEKGVIHRDLKPANVMVGRFGETYVMDWGLAKVLGRDDSHDLRLRTTDQAELSIVRTDRADSSRSGDSPLITMDGDVVGTPCYMSPEQAKGQLEDLGPRSDVYAAGAILYELLTARAPYVLPGERVSPHTVLGMVLNGPPLAIEQITREVPSEIVAICEKAMARDPRERYASMLDVAEDLRAYLENRVVRAYETGSVAEFKKWIGRNKGMAAAMATAGLVALLGLGGVAAVQARANRDLVSANDQITEARDELLDARDELLGANEELGRTNEELATATDHAIEQERAARLRGYSANLAAASASLREYEVREAIRRLDLCDQELRGWEWRRLRLLADSSLAYRQVETAAGAFFPIGAVEFSPDGSRIAVTTGAGQLLLLDAATLDVLLDVDQDEIASSVAWTPDGEEIAMSYGRRYVRIWSASTGELVREFKAHRSFVWDVDVSADGERLLSASGDRTVRIWDYASGEELLELEGHTSAVTTASFDPRGEHIVTGSRDHTVRIWDARTGDELHVLRGHEVPVGAVAFGRGGELIASSSWDISAAGRLERSTATDNTIRIWDAQSGALLKELRGHTDSIADVDFSPDGRSVLSASLDRTLRIWDLQTGTETVLMGHQKRMIRAADFSPDGLTIASGSSDLTVRLWDPAAATGLTITGHPRAVVGLAALGDGRAVSASRGGTLRIWDTTSGEVHEVLREEMLIVDMVCAPGNGRLVTGGGLSATGFGTELSGPYAYLWDVGTGTRLTALDGHTGAVTAVAVTPDGEHVVTGSGDHTVRLWDGRTGAAVALFEQHGKAIEEVAIHPNGETILSSSDDGTFAWTPATGASERIEGLDNVRRLEYGLGGERLLACLKVAELEVRDGASFEVLASLPGHQGGTTDAVYSPDGSRLATCANDGSVRIWDAEAAELLLTIRTTTGIVSQLAFSPDGTQLFGGNVDGRVHVWSTDPPLKRSEARRHAAALREEVRPRVAALFEEHVEPELVQSALARDRSLDAEHKGAAVRLAAGVGGTMAHIEDEVWLAASSRYASSSVYERALWQARLGCLLEPDEEKPLRLLGMTLYRLGRYEEALEVLTNSYELRAARHRARPETAAFLAMTHHRLGRSVEARKYLDTVRALMQIGALQSRRGSIAFLQEAEALIDAPGE
jgi:WD40 repeat protein/serine/threonine protein kinase